MSPAKILLVEDNPADVLLVRFCLTQAKEWPTELQVIGDGEEAITYLSSRDEPKPDLVVLDLNLPKRDGTEVLRFIRSRRDLDSVSVLVYSSSLEDVIRSQVQQADVAADCYATKPASFECFPEIVERFRECIANSGRSGSGERNS